MTELTKMTEVHVTDDAESEMIGAYGLVYKLPGDESADGEVIPDGWVEVLFSPFHRELFRVTALTPVEGQTA